MEYRAWKKQNGAGESIRTSLLGYGCMRFPTTPEGAIDEPRAEALLNAARDAGVNYFDTAYPYHGGQSEPFVGRVIAKWPRESFYLATKMPLWQCGSLEEAQHIFEEQLRRLGVEYIDFYLLHSLHAARYDRAKEMGIVDWLWEQKKLGRIRSFGFSCHDNAAGLEHILRDQPWDFCQLQYNYLDTDDRAEEISGDRGYQLTEELNTPPHHYGAHQGRHTGQPAPGGRSAPQGPAARSHGCLLGPALGGQPPERPCHPLGHECRGSAHG
ncbi:aldo/keto reductase [Faecalibacterium duncaniae]